MIIGISGGTGAGKTTLAKNIIANIGEAKIVYLPQDLYYRDLGDMPVGDRAQVNFDHPAAFDSELLFNQLESLRNGKSIERPIYDFSAHARRPETVRAEPLPAIIVEGILIFHDPRMLRLMDLKIFVDCDSDIRFIRRLERDIRERGRTVESVVAQYISTVRPMHQQFVAPAMHCADIVLQGSGCNDAVVDLIAEKIRSVLEAGHDDPTPIKRA
jgi:uridine kinase